MHSMTGYGRGQLSGNGIQVLVEVQSVNKRQTEILTNVPSTLASLENDIRAKIGRMVSRGRIVVTISVTGPTSHPQPKHTFGPGQTAYALGRVPEPLRLG